MAEPEVLQRLRSLAGFPVVPGTLNLKLDAPFDTSLMRQYVPAGDIAEGWEADVGQAGYWITPVLVASRYRGLAFQADEPGYPPDQVELLCEVHLRNTLGLADGDPLAFVVTE